MAWDFTVYRDGNGGDNVWLRAKVERWADVHTMASFTSVVANTHDFVANGKPKMWARVFDENGTKSITLTKATRGECPTKCRSRNASPVCACEKHAAPRTVRYS
jgi:hypothetical protein